MSSCKDCNKRRLHCHAECETYKAYQKKNNEALRIKNKYKKTNRHTYTYMKSYKSVQMDDFKRR